MLSIGGQETISVSRLVPMTEGLKRTFRQAKKEEDEQVRKKVLTLGLPWYFPTPLFAERWFLSFYSKTVSIQRIFNWNSELVQYILTISFVSPCVEQDLSTVCYSETQLVVVVVWTLGYDSIDQGYFKPLLNHGNPLDNLGQVTLSEGRSRWPKRSGFWPLWPDWPGTGRSWSRPLLRSQVRSWYSLFCDKYSLLFKTIWKRVQFISFSLTFIIMFSVREPS